MNWPDTMTPVRMRRIALLAPAERLRDLLVRVAGAGVVHLDHDGALPAGPVEPRLAARPPDPDGPADVLAGEAQLAAYATDAVHEGSVAGLLGWCPEDDLPTLADGIAGVGGAAVPLDPPPGVDPPTLLAERGRLGRSFAPVVRTYGTVPYPDLDPTLPAGIAYVLMFGMMFGDAGHGLVLVAAALLLRAGRPRVLVRWRAAWPFVAGAGAASILFGLLYGEFFGPTRLIGPLWLAPLEQPVNLLLAGVAVGAGLLAIAYVIAIVNRWREGGPRAAVYATSGIAGAGVFLGIGCLAGGVFGHAAWLGLTGAGLVAVGLLLAAVGLAAEAAGGSTRLVQVGVELVEVLIRIGANLVSFARLAAFGLTHAALSWLVWRGTVALVPHGWAGITAGVLVFAAGNALAFGLEALVAAIQALRLEFYELFSRVFQTEGRPFQPWHVEVS